MRDLRIYGRSYAKHQHNSYFRLLAEGREKQETHERKKERRETHERKSRFVPFFTFTSY